jgi:hypothetical protein
MTRWFVGVKRDGRREVFAESTGTDPIAERMGYVVVDGPYKSEREAAQAARGKPSADRGTPRHRPTS